MRQASKMFETFALMMVTLSLVSSVSVAAAATATIGFSEQPQIQPHAAALISSSSVSASASASSITKPDYGITNVTAQIGTNAYLPCKVSGQHDFFFSIYRRQFFFSFLFLCLSFDWIQLEHLNWEHSLRKHCWSSEQPSSFRRVMTTVIALKENECQLCRRSIRSLSPKNTIPFERIVRKHHFHIAITKTLNEFANRIWDTFDSISIGLIRWNWRLLVMQSKYLCNDWGFNTFCSLQNVYC